MGDQHARRQRQRGNKGNLRCGGLSPRTTLLIDCVFAAISMKKGGGGVSHNAVYGAGVIREGMSLLMV